MSFKWTGPGAKNRKTNRLLLTILLLFLALAIISILCNRPAISQQEPEMYTVKNNDMLWTICREFYGQKMDIRKIVWQVRKLNGIEDPGQLQPGMELWLPIVD